MPCVRVSAGRPAGSICPFMAKEVAFDDYYRFPLDGVSCWIVFGISLVDGVSCWIVVSSGYLSNILEILFVGYFVFLFDKVF